MKPYDKQIGGTHYQKFKIQPSKFVIENELLYPEGCVIKYIIRHRLKGKKQDLEKAIHFIEMIIERDYSKKDFLEEAEKEKKCIQKIIIMNSFLSLRCIYFLKEKTIC